MNEYGGMNRRGVFLLLLALALGLGVSSPSVSAQEEPDPAPIPPPAPTLEPTGLGTAGHLDNLASNCYSGLMQACDDLYIEAPAGSAYESYGDTCAGRQPEGSGRYCTAAFLDAAVTEAPTTAAIPTVAPPPTVATTAATPVAVNSMSAIHADCKEKAISRYTSEYANYVPPSEQGKLAAEATAAGQEINAYLASLLDISLRGDTLIMVASPWEAAATPVGDAQTTERGFLSGAYLSCIFVATQIPEVIFQTYVDTNEGFESWAVVASGANYSLEWGFTENDLFVVAFRLNAAAPVTTAPAPVTTAPAPVVPTAPPVAPDDPTTTAPPVTLVSEDDMFGIGVSGTGPVVPACPVGSYVDGSNGAYSCSPTSTPMPPQTVELATDAACPITGDLEGTEDNPTFTEPAQMKTLVECILPSALAWMTWEYGNLDVPAAWAASQATSLLPNHFIYVPTGVRQTIPDGCLNEDEDGEYSYSDISLAYCPWDGNIYIGEAAAWYAYNEWGDATIWGILAHEWGHRIQHVAGHHRATTPSEVIPGENQADCFAGAFIDFAARNGEMDSVETGDDLNDLFTGMFSIGEAIGEDRTHGTIDQRVRAFFVGYNSDDEQGAWDCDFYITDVSIIPPSSTNQSTQTTAPTTEVVG